MRLVCNETEVEGKNSGELGQVGSGVTNGARQQTEKKGGKNALGKCQKEWAKKGAGGSARVKRCMSAFKNGVVW